MQPKTFADVFFIEVRSHLHTKDQNEDEEFNGEEEWEDDDWQEDESGVWHNKY